MLKKGIPIIFIANLVKRDKTALGDIPPELLR
jgi:hypothetical protein